MMYKRSYPTFAYNANSKNNNNKNVFKIHPTSFHIQMNE